MKIRRMKVEDERETGSADWNVEEYQDDNTMRMIRSTTCNTLEPMSMCDIIMRAVKLRENVTCVRVFCSHTRRVQQITITESIYQPLCSCCRAPA